jgi:leucine dehydrogenase
MGIFEAADFDHHEEIASFEDKETGLKSIIAVHSTALGPACGGTRMYPYANSDAALTDVLRLSRGMSYKNAIAGLPLGGGKAVIIGDPAKTKTEELLLAYARAVEALGGRYITAMDVGVGPADMPTIARGTKHVAGYDIPGKTGGDSGPLTILGVFVGLKAAVKHRLRTDRLNDICVAIQGLGKVGMGLAERLHGEGAKLVVSDVNRDAVKEAVDRFGATAVSPQEIITADCDVFSPNALGAILNKQSIQTLQGQIVAGGANNQLATDEDGAALYVRNVLYAPDYVINGGGIIRVAGQIFGWDDAEIERRTLGIADTLTKIFERSEAESKPTNVIADRMACEIILDAKQKKTESKAKAA